VLEALRSPETATRLAAVTELGRLARGDVRFASSALLHALRDTTPEVRLAAWTVLYDWSWYGLLREVEPVFLELLRDPDPDLRAAATSLLGNADTDEGMQFPAMIDALVRNLGSEHPEYLRLRTIEALERVRFPEDPVIEALRGAVRDPSKPVRLAAVEALGWVAPLRTADDLAASLANDPDPEARRLAAEALYRAADLTLPDQELPAGVARALVLALDDAEPDVQRAAIKTLGAWRHEPAADRLAIFLEDCESACPLGQLDPRTEAIESLADIGLVRHVPLLLRCLESPLPQLREEATWAVGRLGPAATVALPHLTRLATEGSQQERAAALRGIASWGHLAASAVPAIEANLGQGWDVARATAHAALRLASEDVRHPGLLRVLLSGLPQADGVSEKGLVALGPDAAPALEEILNLRRLARQDPRRSRLRSSTVARIARSIGPWADAATPLLVEAARAATPEDPPPWDEWAAVAAISSDATLREEALAELARALEKHPSDRGLIHEIGSIGPLARRFAPRLAALLQDPDDDDLRLMAAMALHRIEGERESAAAPLLRREILRDPRHVEPFLGEAAVARLLGVETLLVRAGHPRATVRADAIRWLGALRRTGSDEERQRVLEALQRAASDPVCSVRHAASLARLRLGT
jgi:HEAT repeat protein